MTVSALTTEGIECVWFTEDGINHKAAFNDNVLTDRISYMKT